MIWVATVLAMTLALGVWQRGPTRTVVAVPLMWDIMTQLMTRRVAVVTEAGVVMIVAATEAVGASRHQAPRARILQVRLRSECTLSHRPCFQRFYQMSNQR